MKDLNIFISFLLGIIQGLTEFIPVSSTAHIRILPAFISINDVGSAYTAVIQLGSLFALIIFFYKDLYQFVYQSIVAIQKEFSKKNAILHIFVDFSSWSFEAKMPIYLIIGTIPISVAGLLLKDWIKGPFRSLYIIAGTLIFFAILLYISDQIGKKNKTIKEINLMDVLWIGIAQSFALIPGASRSGVTLMAGLFLNLDRESSMRFSFLLSIPAIALSGFYELIKDWKEIQNLGIISVSIGLISAYISSYMVIGGLLKYLKSHNTNIFVIYRIILGCILYILLYTGKLSP